MRTLSAGARRAARLCRVPLGIAALLAFALTCQEVTVTPVPVRNVAVTPTDTTLTVGQELQLTAAVTDDAGNRLTDREVTWSSEDNDVVSVAVTGEVVAVSSGEASVTAAVDGRSGTATIHVMEEEDDQVASVEVDPAETSIGVGGTVELEAIARSEDDTVLEGRDVAWSSSDEDVATVNNDGVVTGASAGEATITATVDSVEGSASVTVTEEVEPVAAVEVEPADTSIAVGATVKLEAIARSEDDDVLGGRDVSWSSSDASIATVDEDGVVTGESPGTAMITATIEDVSDTAEVTVSLAAVDRVEISPPEATILVDGTVQLEAIPLSASGDTLEGRPVSWTSDSEDVATVDEEGLVTGAGEGEATIRATVDDVPGTAQVTVSLVPVDSVKVEPGDTTISVGQAAQLSAVALAENGDTLDSRAASWESSDEAIATVDQDGEVEGETPGEVMITAIIEDVRGTANVTVAPAPVDSVTVEPVDTSIFVGQTVQLNAIALSEAGDTLEGREVSWQSDNPAVATVNDEGVVAGRTSGEATITATIDGVPGTAKVTVALVPVESVAVEPVDTSIFVGETVQLNAIALSAEGDTLEGRAVSWQSNNPAVVTVNGDGLVTGNLPGPATITATIEDVPGTANVTVSLLPVGSVDVEPARPSIVVGETVQLVAIPLAANGDTLEGRAASWSSGNIGVATVDNQGLVAGEAAGGATITATIEGERGTARVTVDPQPVESIVVSPDSVDMGILSPVTFTAQVLADDVPLPGRLVTWSVTSDAGIEPCPGMASSTNTNITLTRLSGTTNRNGRFSTRATIDALPLPTAGTAIIYATAEGQVGCAKIVVSLL